MQMENANRNQIIPNIYCQDKAISQAAKIGLSLGNLSQRTMDSRNNSESN